jgi:hypothetical protein
VKGYCVGKIKEIAYGPSDRKRYMWQLLLRERGMIKMKQCLR